MARPIAAMATCATSSSASLSESLRILGKRWLCRYRVTGNDIEVVTVYDNRSARSQQ